MSELISIIVPAYNSENYIERALTSITGQTYKNLEVIVIDDGSTDSTLSKALDYAKRDNRVKVYHKENEGVTIARDYGISKATGKYLGFVDSDDTVDANMYEILYNNLIKYNADISHCGHKYIKGENNIEYFYNTGVIKEQNHNEGLIELITGSKVGPSLCSKLYKTELFYNLEYDKTIKINEDYVINLLVFNKALKSVFFDEPMYNYYKNENSGSSKSTKEYFYLDILKAADLTEALLINNSSVYPYAQRRRFKTYSDMYKNQGKYQLDKVEFDLNKLLSDVLLELKNNYKSLKKNKCLNKSDRFILKMIKYFPKGLVFICKFR